MERALTAIGASAETVRSMWELLGSVLLLGNLSFEQEEDGEADEPDTGVQEIARLAGRAARDFVDDANDEAAEQLSIRLVRLAANAAITPEVGVAVATHQAVAILPEALDAALRRDCEELALNVVSCVTNLSYYALEGRARGLFADLDAILVSNYTCMLGLPYVTEGTGFRGKVYATEPTLLLGRI